MQDNMERQFKQSMTAPEWELEDYCWQAHDNSHQSCYSFVHEPPSPETTYDSTLALV
jgi:hypothetical protein